MHLLPTRGSFYLRSKDSPHSRQHPANVCHPHSAQGADRRHASPGLRPAPVGAEGDRWRVRHACASPMPPSALRAPSPAMWGKGCISCRRGVPFAYVAKTPLTRGNIRPTSAIITARKELTGVTRARAAGTGWVRKQIDGECVMAAHDRCPHPPFGHLPPRCGGRDVSRASASRADAEILWLRALRITRPSLVKRLFVYKPLPDRPQPPDSGRIVCR